MSTSHRIVESIPEGDGKVRLVDVNLTLTDSPGCLGARIQRTRE